MKVPAHRRRGRSQEIVLPRKARVAPIKLHGQALRKRSSQHNESEGEVPALSHPNPILPLIADDVLWCNVASLTRGHTSLCPSGDFDLEYPLWSKCNVSGVLGGDIGVTMTL